MLRLDKTTLNARDFPGNTLSSPLEVINNLHTNTHIIRSHLIENPSREKWQRIDPLDPCALRTISSRLSATSPSIKEFSEPADPLHENIRNCNDDLLLA